MLMKNILILAGLMALLMMGVVPSRADDVALRSGDQMTIRLAGVPSEEINQVSGVYTVDGAGMSICPT